MSTAHIDIAGVRLGTEAPLAFILGPCAIESPELLLRSAENLAKLRERFGIPIVFKSSYDKANRSSASSFRGIGMHEGLRALQRVREEFEFPLISDVHEAAQVPAAAEVLDALQIPAFLCRQTDLLLAAGNSGLPVNIKKGQFMAPWDMNNSVDKIRSTGNQRVSLTERGSSFGYNNLVVDMRSLAIMQQTACPVIFDATHAVQLPGGQGHASDGQSEFVPLLARAAVAAGIQGLFMEVHPEPASARCDGPNMLDMRQLADLIPQLLAIRHALEASAHAAP